MQARSVVCTLFALALGATACGCRGDKTPAPGRSAKSTSAAHGADAATPTAGSEAPQAGEVQLAGTLGCGHCNFHVTADCAAALKTAAGEIYVLDGVQEGSDLWEKRLEPSHQIAVTGAVLGSDKVKHVAMTSFDLK